MNQLDEFQNGEETGTLKRLSQARGGKLVVKKRNSTVISWCIACCYAVVSSRAPVCVCVPRRKGRDAITRARKVSSDSAPALPCLPSGMCITPATNRMFCTLYKNKRVGGCTLSIYKENASSIHTQHTHVKKRGIKTKRKINVFDSPFSLVFFESLSTTSRRTKYETSQEGGGVCSEVVVVCQVNLKMRFFSGSLFFFLNNYFVYEF